MGAVGERARELERRANMASEAMRRMDLDYIGIGMVEGVPLGGEFECINLVASEIVVSSLVKTS